MVDTAWVPVPCSKPVKPYSMTQLWAAGLLVQLSVRLLGCTLPADKPVTSGQVAAVKVTVSPQSPRMLWAEPHNGRTEAL